MRLVALYVGAASPAALEAWARARLPAGWRPRQFLRTERLPRNAMRKLLRRELQQLARESLAKVSPELE